MQISANEKLRTGAFTLDEAERAMTLPKVWWAYAAILPAARRLSVWVANKTRLTPNQITLISFALVMVSSAFFLQGSRTALVAGAVIYQFNYLLDCIDGTIARMKNKSTLQGAFLDFFSDHLKNFIALFSLSYGCFARTGDMKIFPLAMVYIFLDQMYLLRDAKVELMLRKNRTLFFTAPSRFLCSFPFAARIARFMSRARLYSRPTIVDVWAVVFFFGPVFGKVRLAILAGCVILAMILLHQAAKFLVLASRAHGIMERLKSDKTFSIAIFGTGTMAKRVYEWAEENGVAQKIIYTVDNDRTKWGKDSFPFEIAAPERLRKHEFSTIIIASQHGYYDIAFQLMGMRLRPWKDYIGVASC